ncbi:sulfotransferase family protein [Jidongwangia harbinensis]|uniref:sulfotransferase family protein n=1 Tax=Jidongwangia harbinensis TaxID=2878561 RepID=UPI001CD99019|nr:sulfotransferase [Jidongwangia harbinensis]MCA2213707.1 sulfotransferase [Jidongwangia harbinensis]
MAGDRPIIVAGCARSGTTMLQLMLHAHPRIAIPPETRFVLTGYQRRREFGDLRDPARRNALARWIVDRPEHRFADLGLDPDRVAARITAGPGTLGSAFGTVFAAYAERFDKPRWGDKRPAYLQNLDVVRRLFPDAQIINVVRDGRDCVASLKEMSWHTQGLHATIAAWARAVDDARSAARRLDATQWHQLRYEDLVADPPTELAAVCAFLGEDYDPAMTEPAAVADVAVPGFKTWHRRTHAPVTTQRIRSWERRLSADEIALCEAALGSRLAECGYDLSGARRPARSGRLRYGWSAARHRLAPAKRAVQRAAVRLRAEPSVAYVPSPRRPS